MLSLKDMRILHELENDSNRRVADLAKKLGMPRSTIHSRIKRLEKDGIIKTYKAIVDYEKLGKPVTALVHITITSRQSAKEITEKLDKMKNVEDIFVVAGGADIVTKVRFRNTHEIGKFIFEGEKGLRSWPGVEKTVSMIVLEAKKEHGLSC